ncbi:MAG: hypothetical protein IH861_13395 [Chloroflexi bacterium]|nr:hypothetical protein [Chloroflexota bacterium]
MSSRTAIAVQGATRDPDAVFSRGNRHLFMVPWREYTLLGVWHVVYKGNPDEVQLTEEEVQQFLDEFNSSYGLSEPLGLKDVSTWNFGLTLFGENNDGAEDLSYGKQSRILDHARDDGTEGLITVVGVRYTMGRGTARQVVDLVLKNLGRSAPKSRTADTPLKGGDIGPFDDFVDGAMANRPEGVGPESMYAILRNHGTDYRSVVEYACRLPGATNVIGASNTIEAEVIHAVRDEMACKLTDVVLRRTDLGTGEYPGEDALSRCADIMAAELGWNEARRMREIAETRAFYPPFVVRRAREASAHA